MISLYSSRIANNKFHSILPNDVSSDYDVLQKYRELRSAMLEKPEYMQGVYYIYESQKVQLNHPLIYR